MANDDQVSALGGLRPVTQPYGTVKRSYYRLAGGSTGANIYIGQLMDLDGAGMATTVAQGTGITVLTVGPVIGFAKDINGKAGLPDDMSVITAGPYFPAGTKGCYVCIADDPNQEFVIQEASTGTALGTGSIGQTTGFIYTTRSTSGDTVTGSSYAELSPGEASATTSGPLRIVGLADNMNSDGTFNGVGAYAKWRVRISNHRLINPQASGVI